jgi:hypothetical protein
MRAPDAAPIGNVEGWLASAANSARAVCADEANHLLDLYDLDGEQLAQALHSKSRGESIVAMERTWKRWQR